MSRGAGRPGHGLAFVRVAAAVAALAIVAGCSPPPGGPVRRADRPQRRDGPPPPAPVQGVVPPRPDGARAFRLVVISDTNSRYGSVELARRGIPEALALIRGGLRPHLVVHNGDQIAAGGRRTYDPALVAEMWAAFHVTVTDVLRSAGIPLLPVPGNHDVVPAAVAPAWTAQWTAPGMRPPLPFSDATGWPRRYALRFRGVALIVLDAPVGVVADGQRRWLAARLRDARDADLRLVFAHVPIAPLTERNYGHLRPQEPLYRTLREGGADLLVTSHDEVYFRGRWRDQPVLATGGLGSTCRNLRGQAGCQGMSFAVIDVEDGRLARVFAMSGRRFDEVFDESRLPAAVGEDYRR